MFDRIHRNEIREFRQWLKTAKIRHAKSAVNKHVNRTLGGLKKKNGWIKFSAEFRYVAVAYHNSYTNRQED